MIKKIKTTLLSLVAVATLAAPVLAPAVVSAQAEPNIQGGLCAGANLNADETACPPNSGTVATEKVNSTIATVINIFSLVVGVVSVIMIIIGGLRYIISGGDSGNVQSAKNTILYAIIGLVVVALSQFIVQFVLEKASQ